ncbi:type 2 isopentenyl-diphosphate Delta-isomerase [Alkalihalobacterium elongatum]|uniref:type 2 isopentenyl-diphosphate Delta-isomerase n=1 Tax=Alkalihalobacterium elongatum TaxID=2675466 RepID=UPI002E2B3FED|nr:type 2 isopentenyl-diphosphate Delta-isomerase [Alkalihalobacterium elongatum]
MLTLRSVRKNEHIAHAIETGQERNHGYDDIQFVHQSLPNSNIESVDISTTIGELVLSSPIFINAMTGGGGERTKDVNQRLAEVAKDANIGMAVGSQMAAIKNEEERESYRIVRKVNPKGIIIGNLGSEASVEQAKIAADMLEANAMQIHLNVVQELVMPEGDRDFIGAIDRIEKIVDSLPIPVIVKEVGYGMSKETAKKLVKAGVSIVDVGGFGGTNFSKIENKRRKKTLQFFDDWGIKTTSSIVEVVKSEPKLKVIASGGLQNALDIVKSLALGASATGLAGYFLKILLNKGEESLLEEITSIHSEIKMLMTALGTNKIGDLVNVPIVISGSTYHWLLQRGFTPEEFSRR